MFAPLKCKLKQNFLLFSVKLIEYIFSADSVCFNPCLQKIEISFFLLLIFVDELISTCERKTLLSNPIPYPEYLNLSISAFLINTTALNKQFSSVG